MTDWKSLSHEELARDTIRRAQEVEQINQKAWDAVVPAILSAVPLAVPLFVLLLNGPGLLWITTLLIAAPIAILGFRHHDKAIRDCKDFASEMNERRKALEKVEPNV